MYKFVVVSLTFLFSTVLWSASDRRPTQSAAKVGEPAPGFTLLDHAGKTHQLLDYKGKYVVLEWVNFECPYVKKHYESGNMQKTQRSLVDRGVVWLSVISSAPGKQGHLSAEAAKAARVAQRANMTAILLDEKGEVGRAYGAKTTPHLFLIDPKGSLVYAGAIDSIRSTDREDVPKATNYILNAFDKVNAGKQLEQASTEPYGCSIKY